MCARTSSLSADTASTTADSAELNNVNNDMLVYLIVVYTILL